MNIYGPENDLVDWLNMNPLFPGIQTKLAAINSEHCFIITTKQERFVQQILSANQISIPKEQIFGLDRQLSKQQVLRQLQDEHPDHPIVFLEDRLPTLIKVKNDQDLKGIKLLLANWGYNTAQDKQQATDLNLNRIDLTDFSTL